MLANRVREYSITLGTGDITLGGAMAGHISFGDAFTVGDSVIYVIEDGDNYEIGTGTYGAGNVLARTSISETLEAGILTRSGALAITLSGQAKIYCAATAEFLLDPTEAADTITEATPGAGVTVDGVLLKDGAVSADGGTFSGDVIVGDGTGGNRIVTIHSAEGNWAQLLFQGDLTGTEYVIGRNDVANLDAFAIGRSGGFNDIILDNAGNTAFFGDVSLSNIGQTINIGDINTIGRNGAGNVENFQVEWNLGAANREVIWTDSAGNHLVSIGSALLDIKTAMTVGGNIAIANGSGFRVGGAVDTYIGQVHNVAGILSITADANRDIQLGDTVAATLKLDTSAKFAEFFGGGSFAGDMSITHPSNPTLKTYDTAVGVTSSTRTLGIWLANGQSTTGVERTFGSLTFDSTDALNAAEDGKLTLRLIDAGALVDVLATTPNLFDVKTAMRVAGNIVGANLYQSVNTSTFIVGGGNGTGVGADLVLYGGAHATRANDARLRAAGVDWLSWDSSAGIAGFSGVVATTVKGSAGTPAFQIDSDGTGGATGFAGNSDLGVENIAAIVGGVQQLLISDTLASFSFSANGFERVVIGASTGVTNNNGLWARGGTGVSIIAGSDGAGWTLTDATQKVGRIASPHYTNAEEPVALIMGVSDATTNVAHHGGGSVLMNAVTEHKFYTAANNTTPIGTLALSIDSSQNVIGSSHIAAIGGTAAKGPLSSAVGGKVTFLDVDGGGNHRVGAYDYDLGVWKNLHLSSGILILNPTTGESTFAGDVVVGTNTATPQNIKFYANRTGGNQSLGGSEAYWNNNRVTRIEHQTGVDTVNKDNGQLVFFTAPDGVTGLVEALRIGSGQHATFASGVTLGGSLDMGGNLLDMNGGSLSNIGNLTIAGAQNAYLGLLHDNDTNLTLGSAAGTEPRGYLYGSANGQANAGNLYLSAASSGGDIELFSGLHATLAGDANFRSGGVSWLYWDQSASTATFAGDVSLSGNDISNVSTIYRASSTGSLVIAAGLTSSLGARIAMYSEGHVTRANDLDFFSGGAPTLSYDDSLNSGTWDAQGTDWTGIADLTVSGMVNYGTIAALTVTTNAVTVSKRFSEIDTSTAAQTVKTINGGTEGDEITVCSNSSLNSLTVQDIASGGNLQIAGDFIMNSPADTLTLFFDGTNWREISRSNNA